MKKDAIKNIKDSFDANEGTNELHHNEHGHCFTAGGAGLTAIRRSEVDSLVADEDKVAEPSEEEKEAKKREALDARAEKVGLPAGSSEEDIKAAEKASKKK